MATATDYQRPVGELSSKDVPDQPTERRSKNKLLLEYFQYIVQCLQDETSSKQFQCNWPLTLEKDSEFQERLGSYKTNLNESWNQYWEWFVNQERQRLIKGVTQLYTLSKRSQEDESAKTEDTKQIEGIEDKNVPPYFRQNVEMMKDLWAIFEEKHSSKGSEIPSSPNPVQEETEKKKSDILRKYTSITKTSSVVREYLQSIMEYIISVIKNSFPYPDEWPSFDKKMKKRKRSELTNLTEIISESWGQAWKCCDKDLVQLTELLTHVHQSCFGDHQNDKIIDDVCDKLSKELKTHGKKLKHIQQEVLKRIKRQNEKKGTKGDTDVDHAILQPDQEIIDGDFNSYEQIMIEITELIRQNTLEGFRAMEIKTDVVSKDLSNLYCSIRKLLESHWEDHSKDLANTQSPWTNSSNKHERNVSKYHACKIYDEYLVHLKNILDGKSPYTGEFPSIPSDVKQDETLCEVCRNFKMAVQDHWQRYHEHSNIEKKVYATEEKKHEDDSNVLQNEEDRQNKPETKQSNDVDKKNQEETDQSQKLDISQEVKRQNKPKTENINDDDAKDSEDKSESKTSKTLRDMKRQNKPETKQSNDVDKKNQEETDQSQKLDISQEVKRKNDPETKQSHDDCKTNSEDKSQSEGPDISEEMKSLKKRLDDTEKERKFYIKYCQQIYMVIHGGDSANTDTMDFEIPETIRPEERRTILSQKQIQDLRTQRKKGELLKEISSLRTRLSELAGARLQYNNPSITDLSDPNRPTKLSEGFCELYDNEWTNAFECFISSGITDKIAISYLLSYLEDCYNFCTVEFKTKLESVCELYTGHRSADINKYGQKHNLTEIEKKSINDAHKTGMSLLHEASLKKFLESRTTKQPAIKNYLDKCFSLCWMMRMQTPPVCLDADFKRGDDFNTTLLRFYTKSGKKIDYLVWPALMLHKGGSILCKGVAQPL